MDDKPKDQSTEEMDVSGHAMTETETDLQDVKLAADMEQDEDKKPVLEPAAPTAPVQPELQTQMPEKATLAAAAQQASDRTAEKSELETTAEVNQTAAVAQPTQTASSPIMELETSQMTPPPTGNDDDNGVSETQVDEPRSLLKPILLIGGLVFLINLSIGMFILFGDKLPWMNMSEDNPVVDPAMQGTETKKGELLIGGIAPLTGDAASFGLPLQQAAFLAQEEINKNGGIDNKNVRIVWKDGRCQREDAKIAAEDLVNKVGVELLIAGMCSSEFLAAAEVAQPAEVISYSPSATSPEISELGAFVLRTAPSDALAGKAAAEYSYNFLEARSAVILYEDNDYTQSLRTVFGQRFAELGGEIVAEQSFTAGETDFSGTAAEIRRANPDVIYLLPQSSTPGLLALQAIRDAGVEAQIMTAEVLLDRENLEQQGNLLEGITGIELAFDQTRPEAVAFLDLYRDEYETEPVYPGYMAGMYDLMYLIKDAYEANGGDTNEMMKYYYSLDSWSGAVGEIKWNTQGDPQMAFSIKQIKDGEIEEVDVYTPGE